MANDQRVSLILEAFDEARRPDLGVLLARLSGKPFDRIDPHLDRLPWRLASSLPESRARELASRLEAVGARVRLEPVPAPAGEAGAPAKEPPAPPAAPAGQRPPPGPLGWRRRLRWALRIAFGTKLTQVALLLVLLGLTLLVNAGFALLGGGTLSAQLESLFQGGTPPDPARLLGVLHSPQLWVLVGAQLLLSLLTGTLYQGAMLRLAPAYFRQGARPPFWSLLRGALARLPDLVTTTAILFLPLMLLPLVGLLGIAPEHPVRSLLVGIGALVVTLVLGLALFLVLPVAANEPVGPWRAIVRGWRLASGYRLAFFGHMVLLWLLMLLILFGGMALLGGLAFAAAHAQPLLAAVIVPVGYGALLLGLYFYLATFPVLAVLFYLEARARREGACFDWVQLPAEDWPRCEAEEERAGRGALAWGEFLLLNGGVVAALVLAAPWLEGHLAGLAMLLQAARPSAVQAPTGPAPAVPNPAPAPSGGTGSVPVLTAPTGVRFGDGTLDLVRDTFFPDPKAPQLWIRLQARGLFAGAASIPSEAVTVHVREVRARNGRNVLDASSPFETNPVFSRMQWMKTQGGYKAIRTVHLKPGIREADLTVIKGELVLRGRDVGHMTIPFALRDKQPYHVAFHAGRIRPLAQAASVPSGTAANGTADPEQAAYALYRQRRYREAIHLLDGILAAHPDNAWAWYTRAWAYWKLGDRDKAYADVAKACDLGYKDACALKKQP